MGRRRNPPSINAYLDETNCLELDELHQRDILGFDLVSFFATELIFVPIAYFQKTKRTYRKELIYDPSEVVR